MEKVKNLLSVKILVPVLVGGLLLIFMGYILIAPETWWKPFYVSVVTADTVTPGAQTDVAMQGTVLPGDIPQGAASPNAMPQQTSPAIQLDSEQSAGVMYELDSKVVNLAEPGGLRYLQTSIVLELWPLVENFYQLEGEERLQAVEQFQETIDRRRPVIDDIVTTLLSNKTFNEISSVEGKKTLKEELTAAINESLGYQGVLNIYFTDFIVQ